MCILSLAEKSFSERTAALAAAISRRTYSFDLFTFISLFIFFNPQLNHQLNHIAFPNETLMKITLVNSLATFSFKLFQTLSSFFTQSAQEFRCSSLNIGQNHSSFSNTHQLSGKVTQQVNKFTCIIDFSVDFLSPLLWFKLFFRNF